MLTFVTVSSLGRCDGRKGHRNLIEKRNEGICFIFYVENIRILAGVHHNTFENYQELTKGVALNLFIVKRFKQLWIGKYDLDSIGELRITEF